MKKNNILLLSTAVSFGGGESYLLNLEKLLKKDYNLLLITSSKTLRNKSEIKTVYIRKILFFYHFFLLFTLIKKLASSNFNIAILNGSVEALYSVLLNFFGIKTIVVKHTDFHLETDKINNLKNKFHLTALNQGNCIVSVSKHVYGQLKKFKINKQIKDQSIHLIPNWTEKKYINANHKPLNDGNFHILIVARLVKLKGHLDLFKACENIEKLIVHVVGDGPLKNEFIKKSKNLNVVFHGFQDNVKPFYEFCHLQVLPSYIEGGHPLCLLEGMAVGIPSIGTNIPTIAEILPKENICELNNIQSLRKKIIKFRQKTQNNKIIHNNDGSYKSLIKNLISNDLDQIKPIEKTPLITKQKFTIPKKYKDIIVTIIVPLFNDEEVINRMFKYNIKYFGKRKDLEFIFIDDCSQDRTIEFLEKNLKNSHILYKLIKNQNNSGPSFSRNQGIKVSRGSYIAFLDSDDIWHPWKIDVQLSVLKDHEVDLCVSDHQFVDIEKIESYQSKGQILTFNLKSIKLLNFIFKTQFVLPSVVAKRNVFLNNYFNENLRYGEDFELWLRLIVNNKKIIKVNSLLTAIVKRDKLNNMQGLSDNVTLMFANLSKTLIAHFLSSPLRKKPVFFIATIFMQIRYLTRVLGRVFKLAYINFIRT